MTQTDSHRGSLGVEHTGDSTYQFDQSLDKVSLAVIGAVADATGTDPMELPPLYSAIDTEALDALFASSIGKVSFSYNGFEILVEGDGTIRLD